MLNSSLRRVARTCPNASAPTRHSTSGSSKPVATFSTHCHQRRCSSSKPPIPPNNGSPSIPAASVKQVGAPRASDKRAGAESRLSKRKAVKAETGKHLQDTKENEWVSQLPSVPSTQHLNPKDVYVASFFSTHRPISISGPLPPETQVEDIDKIFQVRPRRLQHGPAEVLYTLRSAIQNFDENIQQSQPHQSEQQMAEQRAEIIKSLTHHNNAVSDGSQTTHLDGQPQRGQGAGNVKFMIQELARRFRPFHAPPPPVPAPDVDLLGEYQDAQSIAAKESQSVDNLELEIERQDGEKMILQLNNLRRHKNLPSGQFFTSRAIVSHPTSTNDITEPSIQPAKGGRLRRTMHIDQAGNRRRSKYYTISVKRQRRLKMKKHKYKKLMRKTRNLRRRQDRL